jgi:hypothetical protein
MKKAILISVIVFVILVPLSVFLAFEGVFDKKYSRESLTRNFVEHENDFADVAAFFEAHLSKNENFSVSFVLGRRGSVNLYIFPDVVDPANKTVGGDDMEIGSLQLDSTIAKLGWTNEIVKKLREKLTRTNCDWIRTLDGQGDKIEIYPSQSGWGSFSYSIYQRPIADSLDKIYGRPLGKSGFGKRVVLNYRAAL